MFTGLIQECGVIEHIEENSSGVLLRIQTSSSFIENIRIDDSISLNGICQTVIHIDPSQSLSTGPFLTFQAVHVTLEKTTLKFWKKGQMINLEKALSFGQRMGGHWVQGHINTTAQLQLVEKRGDNYQLTFSLAQKYLPFIINEGSITVDGISLTVAKVFSEQKNHLAKLPMTPQFQFMVSIIPHTWEKTQLQYLNNGDWVNIEVDVMSQYAYSILKYAHLMGESHSYEQR